MEIAATDLSQIVSQLVTRLPQNFNTYPIVRVWYAQVNPAKKYVFLWII